MYLHVQVKDRIKLVPQWHSISTDTIINGKPLLKNNKKFVNLKSASHWCWFKVLNFWVLHFCLWIKKNKFNLHFFTLYCRECLLNVLSPGFHVLNKFIIILCKSTHAYSSSGELMLFKMTWNGRMINEIKNYLLIPGNNCLSIILQDYTCISLWIVNILWSLVNMFCQNI